MSLLGSNRPTGDIIAILISLTVSIVLIVAVVGVVVVRVFAPDVDISSTVVALGQLVTVLVGFTAGRAGRPSRPPDPPEQPYISSRFQ